MSNRVRVAGATEADIPALEEQFPEGVKEKHRARLRGQRLGRAIYLIAWLDGQPAGHGLLIWSPIERSIAARLTDCAEITDVFVHPSLRSQGIGSAILAAAERRVRKRGCSQIGLSVSLENPRARALYERLGYRDAGFGEFVVEGSWVDPEGRTETRRERCVYLTKPLERGSPANAHRRSQ